MRSAHPKGQSRDNVRLRLLASFGYGRGGFCGDVNITKWGEWVGLCWPFYRLAGPGKGQSSLPEVWKGKKKVKLRDCKIRHPNNTGTDVKGEKIGQL